MTFQLHSQLVKDTVLIGQYDLCRILLMNDSQFPWCILVPEVAAITEIYQLSRRQQEQLIQESSRLAGSLAGLYKADKMNIAAIGNLVPQLHIHHVVRYRNDKAWPAPVWGKFDAVPYTETGLSSALVKIRQAAGL